jgi:lia operon protein LiaI
MRKNSGSGFAILLILCGALILLGKFNFGFGHLIGYLVPLAMVVLGYYSVKNGSKFVGWIIMILGALILLSKFSWLIGLVIAIALIGYGVSILKRNNSAI